MKIERYLGLALAVLLLPTTSHAGFKCWTNSDGIRECGNVIPPEYRGDQADIVNERGMTIDVKERARTPEEIEAARLAEEQAERERKEEERLQREQAAYDNVLLSTFSTQSDIINSQDRNLSAIDGSIEITRITRDKLQQKLDDLNAMVERKRSLNQTIPTNTDSNIELLQGQIDRKNAYIKIKQQEAANLRSKYEAYLKRFCELRVCEE